MLAGVSRRRYRSLGLVGAQAEQNNQNKSKLQFALDMERWRTQSDLRAHHKGGDVLPNGTSSVVA